MFCKYCGIKIADNSAFCPMCGKKVKDLFEKWLTKKGGGNISHTTKDTYMSAINKFQSELLGFKKFYECDISLIIKVRENEDLFFAKLRNSAAAASSAIEKYRTFWMGIPMGKAIASAKGAVLHKAVKKT